MTNHLVGDVQMAPARGTDCESGDRRTDIRRLRAWSFGGCAGHWCPGRVLDLSQVLIEQFGQLPPALKAIGGILGVQLVNDGDEPAWDLGIEFADWARRI